MISLKIFKDKRGEFLEILKTENSGQFSFFTMRPGYIRGEHFHNTKFEKFLVVEGKVEFKFQHLFKKKIYKVVEKLVYWCFTESNRYFDIKLEGIITKKFYDRITKDEYTNKEYSFGEVIDNMGDVEFKIEEIKFDNDPEIIIAYKIQIDFMIKI
jgi:UDP-2-acetamido-2,6-beta-L-arabino-hexul-4-ose reductase